MVIWFHWFVTRSHTQTTAPLLYQCEYGCATTWCVCTLAHSLTVSRIQNELKLLSNVGQIHHFGLITHMHWEILSLWKCIRYAYTCLPACLPACAITSLLGSLAGWMAGWFVCFTIRLSHSHTHTHTMRHIRIPSSVYWFQWKSKHVSF